jgi:hypothetical protein
MINKMSDLYGSTDQAVALGNMRHKAVRDYNDRVREHNQTVSTTIQGLKDQVQNNATIKEAQDIAQNLWTGHGMPDKIKAYQDWRAARAQGTAGANTPADTQAQGQRDTATTVSDDAETPAQSTTASAQPEPVDEGSPAGLGAEEEAETLTGRIKNGIVNTTGISKEGLEEGLEMAGKGATVVGALGVGGMDIYNEYKSLSSGKGLSGDNWEEKTGNLLQLGGSISDIVGTAFPPAKLLGGILDLSAGALSVVGEKVAETKKEGELDTEEQGQDEQGPAQVEAQTAVTARTQ